MMMMMMMTVKIRPKGTYPSQRVTRVADYDSRQKLLKLATHEFAQHGSPEKSLQCNRK